MESFKKIKQLRLLTGKTTYDISESTGIPQSTISKIENNKRKLEPAALKVLSNYFNVSYNFLLNDSEIDCCAECGFEYYPLEKEDFEYHKIRHSNFLDFSDRELFLTYSDREAIKRKSQEILSKDDFNIPEKINAAINIYQCWYSRSIEACNFSNRHPSFDEYISMMLNKKDTEDFLPAPVYNFLVERYGRKEGILDGESYVTLKKINAAFTEEEKQLLGNYNKLNDLGKNEAIKRVSELTEMSRYTYVEPTTIAAHNDELTEEENEIAFNRALELINKKKK